MFRGSAPLQCCSIVVYHCMYTVFLCLKIELCPGIGVIVLYLKNNSFAPSCLHPHTHAHMYTHTHRHTYTHTHTGTESRKQKLNGPFFTLLVPGRDISEIWHSENLWGFAIHGHTHALEITHTYTHTHAHMHTHTHKHTHTNTHTHARTHTYTNIEVKLDVPILVSGRKISCGIWHLEIFWDFAIHAHSQAHTLTHTHKHTHTNTHTHTHKHKIYLAPPSFTVPPSHKEFFWK